MSSVPSILSTELSRLGEDVRIQAVDHNASDVEELVSKAVHLYSRLNRQHERWAGPIRDGLRPFSLDEARLWQNAFQQWADDARRIINVSREFEERGYFIEQLDVLRGDLRHCFYDGVSVDRLVANAQMHGEGKGISGEVLRHELQNRLRAAGG